MKISLNWLADYLPGPLAAQAAGEALTHGGFPVEVFEKHGDDDVIDVEVTSNRGDCLSHVGVARELAALLGREWRDVRPVIVETGPAVSTVASVAIEAGDLCPHYTARVIRGVKIGPSPDWMIRRLEAAGLRPINNVVDVTNYVMFELGQPLHAFDFDKLKGGRIVVRAARPGEKLITIDGKEATLSPDMLTIADAERPVALAGVMGGRDSEVSDQTTSILLESARFDPLSVRKTARAIVRSDSSYRFERGIDPLLPEKASQRAAELILKLAGGQLLAGAAEAGQTGWKQKVLTLRMHRLGELLGRLPNGQPIFDAAEVEAALLRLGLKPKLSVTDVLLNKGVVFDIEIPSHRLDLNIETDLIEEAARILGYDRIPVREEIAIRVTPPQPANTITGMVRDTLIAAGYFEAMTPGFVSDLLADDFVPPEASKSDPLPRAASNVRKADAKLRPSVLPGLLEAVRRNETNGTDEARLFEIGPTFFNAPAGQIVEHRQVALVGSSEIREVRGAVEAVLARLDKTRAVKVIPADRPGYTRGAAGQIHWGDQPVGWIGRIAKPTADKLSLRHRPCAAELELDPLLTGAQLVQQLTPLPRFPSVRRDLSFVLAESVKFEAVESVVRKTGPQWLETLEYVTTYRGKPLEKGTKSVTITLVFRSTTETLTSEQVESSVGQVVDAAKGQLGATLRT